MRLVPMMRKPLFWSAFFLIFALGFLPNWSDPFGVRAAGQVFGDLTVGRIVKWSGTFAAGVSVDTLTTSAPDPNNHVTPANNVDLSATISGTATGDATYTFDCDTNVTGTRPTITRTGSGATSATDTDACSYTRSGIYVASVTVSRGGASDSKNLQFMVGQPPTANAGQDQGVNPGTSINVILSGGGTDPDGDLPLTYAWTQTAGTAVTLSSATAQNPTFTFTFLPSTTLTFSLVATDSSGRASAADTVNIAAGTGTVKLRGTLDGAVWPAIGSTANLTFDVAHTTCSGGICRDINVAVPGDYSGLPTGSWTLTNIRGGPAGTMITPPASQSLANGGNITFTFNFVTPAMTLALASVPPSGSAPFAPTLTATASGYNGDPADTLNYSFWWDCANSGKTVREVEAVCGVLLADTLPDDGICTYTDNDQIIGESQAKETAEVTTTIRVRGAKCSNETMEIMPVAVQPPYGTAGTKTAKIVVERNLFSGEKRRLITVTPPNTAPVAVAGWSRNQTIAADDRIYNEVVAVRQGENIPRLFFAGFRGSIAIATGRTESTDPDGWTEPERGVKDGGKCEWNANLDQEGPTFEVLGIASPPSALDCRISSTNGGSGYIFNDSPVDPDGGGALTADDQIFRVIGFNALKITDVPG
ncbi:MAG: hypothetical protein WAP52_00700, partial [Candidatus Sungiibacteriota bacterium]